MSMMPSISAATPASGAPAIPKGMGDDVKALGKALRSGDLAAARAAYVGIVKAAPDGATLEAGTPFAAIGKALKTGDVEAAKKAFMEAARARFGSNADSPDAVIVKPAPVATTDGTLHVVV